MNILETEIPDVLIIEPKVFGDDRGFFFESYNQSALEERIGSKLSFVQDNHSKSKQGVLRGLHYQAAPYGQAKLVRCVVGEVFDVAVDIRRDSSTYGRWVGANLSAENKRQLWIPDGFAHGFLVLSETAEFLYKTTNYYAPTAERSIAWNDPTLDIKWPLPMDKLILSTKDMQAGSFTDLK
ncbi:dTDP-4-dehydrorhamnose 3,5-epimerase [Kosakonia arachidis]|uniref:dTDP-4-dehydrorhamnose 3,5-epimerase n=1 Tax=Kosakonia arachidis TaxID=551989 RepID=A0A1I7D126_9ENTR|nr:dTDP-4-dehydrorhamnose 3,5-epimerase [Kosakonia arachidis]SFU05353.1 dTDP-4-dehydrorhamnose 3,5-epimerase [Kosakonia arachidis]